MSLISSPPATYDTSVLQRWSPTPSTRGVRLARPQGFLFQTSQAVRFYVNTPDGEAYRPMTIASSPEREYLDFVARRSDSTFKQAFFDLEPGDSVKLWGPRGNFLLHWRRPAVMLAGGIGITPFRSMLQTIVDRGFGPPVFLIYGNHSPREVAFMEELDQLAHRGTGIEVLYTVSDVMAGELWAHRTGRIDMQLLKTVWARLPEAVCYLAGPLGFVDVLRAALVELGVHQDDLLAEVFRGYDEG